MKFDEWLKFFPIGYKTLQGGHRGFPNNRTGSNFDWWISCYSPNSILKRNKFIGTMDLIEHIGEEKSTWRK